MVAIAVQNASFETPTFAAPGEYSYTQVAPPGWVKTGAGGVWRPLAPAEADQPADGANVAWVEQGGSLFQDLGILVDPTSNYQLQVGVGAQHDFPSASNGYLVQ